MKYKLLFIFFAFSLMTAVHAGLQDDINRAADIINGFTNLPEKSIPKEVLDNAKGLAIITVVKGGFVFSGHAGSGIVIARLQNGSWSAPSAIGLGGAGWGFQIGAQVTDFVFVLNTYSAIDAFSRGQNVTLGGNLSVSAGPLGRTAQVGVTPMAAIYSYSRSQGLFAGISVEGTILVEREEANQKFYGKPVRTKELLQGRFGQPMSAWPLYRALNSY